MSGRAHPRQRPRPWKLAVMVERHWLSFKRQLDFADVDAGKRYADKVWHGAFITLTHDQSKAQWVRRGGSWFYEGPPGTPVASPAPAPTPSADEARLWWQERD